MSGRLRLAQRAAARCRFAGALALVVGLLVVAVQCYRAMAPR